MVYLVIAVALVLAGVFVDEVVWVAGKLDTAGLLALAEESVAAACIKQQIISAIHPPNALRISIFKHLFLALSFFALQGRRTGDLPDQIVAEVLVLGRHLDLLVPVVWLRRCCCRLGVKWN